MLNWGTNMSKKDFNYLDEERKKIWLEVNAHRDALVAARETIESLQNDISTLTEAVDKKTSDYERDAKNSSASVTRYKNKARESLKEAEDSKYTILELLETANEMTTLLSDASDKYAFIKAQDSEISESCNVIATARDASLAKEKEVDETFESARANLVASQSIADNMTGLQSAVDAINEKVTSLHSQSAKRTSEISKLHNDIFGYTYDDEETGEEATVEGLKSELDGSYVELEKNISSFSEELIAFKNEKINEYGSFQIAKNEEFNTIKNKIKSLLPGAMTTGLSYAYEEKRKTEEAEQVNAAKSFRWSIIALSLISILPIAVSLYSFFHDLKTLDEIIQNLPRVVLAIVPLYAPAFWFAIVANKRIKLSKRLIEEYAHKESLSKTFEGLSTHIVALEDSETSKELSIRLLYNIISVSAENPGKLISNYDQSDNPILDVLDKSASLSKSIEKMSTIPGIEFILQKVMKNQSEKKNAINDAVRSAVGENEESISKQ